MEHPATSNEAHARLKAIPADHLSLVVAAVSNALRRGQTLSEVHATVVAMLRCAKDNEAR